MARRQAPCTSDRRLQVRTKRVLSQILVWLIPVWLIPVCSLLPLPAPLQAEAPVAAESSGPDQWQRIDGHFASPADDRFAAWRAEQDRRPAPRPRPTPLQSSSRKEALVERRPEQQRVN